MASELQIAANRRNALRSTGPRTRAGKARAAKNACKHGMLAASTLAVPRGPFVEDPAAVTKFCRTIVAELQPATPLEVAEAQTIAGLVLRRARVGQLEALALAVATRAPMLPPEAPGLPKRIVMGDLEDAAAGALSSQLLQQLPRYEAHLSRELDRSLARYRQLQQQ